MNTGAAGLVLARGVLVLAGLAVTALGFTWFVDAHHRTVAHHGAPACGTAAATPGTDCVRHETGKVTARRDLGEDSYELRISRESASTDRYTVGRAFFDDVEVGTDVDLTVFRGRVAAVSYHGHRAENLIMPWLTSLEVALLVAAGSALIARGVARPRRKVLRTVLHCAFWVALLACFGALLILSFQAPLALALGLPLLGWLLATAVITAILVTAD
ncbi:hypothetical protein [Kitasatospora sp. NPDC086791]|uniref:hypothetical protein n=1 Tax=Kitasatospora sp. NPDC086791 TaxID=3155178 RepID=UPI00343D58CD